MRQCWVSRLHSNWNVRVNALSFSSLMNASANSSKSSNFRKSVRGSMIHAKVRNIDPRIEGDFEYLKLAEFVIFIWILNVTLYLDFPSKQGFTCQTEFHIIQTCAHKGGRHQYIPILILVTPPDMSECWFAGCKRLIMTKNTLNSGQSGIEHTHFYWFQCHQQISSP